MKYAGKLVTRFGAYSVDNNLDWADLRAGFLRDRSSVLYYQVPNSLHETATVPELLDHIDSMVFASERLLGHDGLAFFVELEDGADYAELVDHRLLEH